MTFCTSNRKYACDVYLKQTNKISQLLSFCHRFSPPDYVIIKFELCMKGMKNNQSGKIVLPKQSRHKTDFLLTGIKHFSF